VTIPPSLPTPTGGFWLVELNYPFLNKLDKIMIVPNSADTCETIANPSVLTYQTLVKDATTGQELSPADILTSNAFNVTQNFGQIKEKMCGISEDLVITFTRDPDVPSGLGNIFLSLFHHFILIDVTNV
jgi:hypothetical protein